MLLLGFYQGLVDSGIRSGGNRIRGGWLSLLEYSQSIDVSFLLQNFSSSILELVDPFPQTAVDCVWA